jgi:hypothetical protein
MIRSDHVGNERAACASLDAILLAEDAFRQDDLDRNGIKDYWTRDVAGLHSLNLIPENIARADQNPATEIDWQGLDRKYEPSRGYWFRALPQDGNRSGFRYAALPSLYGKTGENLFIVDQSRRLLRRDFKDNLVDQGSPPTLNGKWSGEWPPSEEISELWTPTR